MTFDVLVPVTALLCIAYAIKVVADVMLHRHILNNCSGEVVASVLREEQRRRRDSALRSGMVLLALAAALGLIQELGLREVTPGMIALLVGATGFGNVAFFALSRRLAAGRHRPSA